MATHISPTSDCEIAAKPEFVASRDHLAAAGIAMATLDRFTVLKIRDIQFPRDSKYTCWYASIDGFPKLPVINLGLFPNNVLDVEFRYVGFLLPKYRDGLRWQTTNWLCARIAPTKFSLSHVTKMLDDYVPRVQEANSKGLLKRGGTSYAETVVADSLTAYYTRSVKYNVRPEWLRTDRGSLVELDVLLEDEGVAIEIQGIQHFRDLFGQSESFTRLQGNDKFKVEKLLSTNKSMIWILATGIQDRAFLKESSGKQWQILANLIELACLNRPCHVIWESMDKPAVLHRQSM
jgi:hypothetical protein